VSPPWAPVAGASILIPSGPAAGQMHLHVVLNDPMPMQSFGNYACAVACFCSVPLTDLPYESNLVFNAGDHPFFVRQTYVAYRHFQVMQAQHLTNCVQNGPYTARAPDFSPDVVASIIAGYRQSTRIPRSFKGLPL
jgi:hypothetical protein